MATAFASLRCALRPSVAGHLAKPCRASLRVRALHLSPVALRKQHQGAITGAEDAFAEEEDDDSLFPSSSGELFDGSAQRPVPPHKPAQVNVTDPSDIPQSNPSVPAPRKYDRNARFENIYSFTKSCIVDKDEVVRQIRTSVWNHLITLATTPEQLERIAALMPAWRNAKRKFAQGAPELFARQCARHRCPGLALQVFGNHPKYGLDLTPKAARVLLHALSYNKHPIQDIITLTALYGVYKLPPISNDLVSCTLVVSSCLSADTPESVAVAQALLPSLQQLLTHANLAEMRRVDKRRVVASLAKIQLLLEQKEIDAAWLKQWRATNGLADEAGSD
ncbi:hypothetical protein BD413DRAFT_493542 [Trametes elegans]|nr:hypothetical protein BD413DRAFT_493542 [Trametes elegans]